MKTHFEINGEFRLMNNEELVCILTRSGFVDQLKEKEAIYGEFDGYKFTDILDNMTPSKKRLVLAGVELYKRCNMQRNKQKSIRQGKDVYELMVPIMGDNRTEEVWGIFLSQSNKIIRKMRVAFGGYTSCLIDVRVILKEALACEAVSLILCHNHPSGNRLPSTDDDRMTQRINEASKIIGLRLIDHVIICRDSYYSYIEEGRI